MIIYAHSIAVYGCLWSNQLCDATTRAPVLMQPAKYIIIHIYVTEDLCPMSFSLDISLSRYVLRHSNSHLPSGYLT